MKLQTSPHYYVYIVTDEAKTRLQTGVTGDLSLRLYEHEKNWMHMTDGPDRETCCRHLVWWEHFPDPAVALKREQEISQYSIKKKHKLITDTNTNWRFLNSEIKKEMKIHL